jgi:hypothetical protein
VPCGEHKGGGLILWPLKIVIKLQPSCVNPLTLTTPRPITPTRNPELRTPSWTATPTGPRSGRAGPYVSSRPMGTLPSGPAATTTETVDRAGQQEGRLNRGLWRECRCYARGHSYSVCRINSGPYAYYLRETAF